MHDVPQALTAAVFVTVVVVSALLNAVSRSLPPLSLLERYQYRIKILATIAASTPEAAPVSLQTPFHITAMITGTPTATVMLLC